MAERENHDYYAEVVLGLDNNGKKIKTGVAWTLAGAIEKQIGRDFEAIDGEDVDVDNSDPERTILRFSADIDASAVRIETDPSVGYASVEYGVNDAADFDISVKKALEKAGMPWKQLSNRYGIDTDEVYFPEVDDIGTAGAEYEEDRDEAAREIRDNFLEMEMLGK